MSAQAIYYDVLSTQDNVLIGFHVANYSEKYAANIVLTLDTIPAGLTFDTAFIDKGSFDTLTKIWSIPKLEPNEAQTLYVKFTIDDVSQEQEILASVVGAYNAEYPGEYETNFIYTVRAIDLAQQQDSGYETAQLVSIYGNSNGVITAEMSGILYVITAAGNTTLQLPSVFGLNPGDIIKVKVIADNGHTVKIKADGAETIDGNNEVTLVTGDYKKLSVCRSCPGDLWILT